LTGFPQSGVPDSAGWKQLGSLSQTPCFFRKALLKRFGLFETIALLHLQCSRLSKAGARAAISSPIDTMNRAVTEDNESR
jgi:hypothetical protein